MAHEPDLIIQKFDLDQNEKQTKGKCKEKY